MVNGLMSKHRSISQRLSRAKSVEVKQEVALDWATNWQNEQSGLILQLGKAIANDDYDLQCRISGQLKAVTEKRFIALPKVIDALIKSDTDND